MITGATFPKDLLQQNVEIQYCILYFQIFLPDNIFTFKHYMLDFILKIVEWRLQNDGVNQVSLLVIFVIFQRVDCPEYNNVNTPWSPPGHLQATAAPRL